MKLPKKPILLIIPAIIIAAIATTIIAMGGSKDGPTDKDPARSTFTNWLEPKSKLLIGENDYTSTCQLVPAQQVESKFGDLTSSATYHEKYIDKSIPTPGEDSITRYVTTQCTYFYADDKLGQKIDVNADQFFDKKYSNRLDIVMYADDQKTGDKVAAYEQATSKSDQKTKDFVSLMRSSLERYKKLDGVSSNDITDSMVNGVVLPAIGSFTTADTGFSYKQGSTIYRVSYTPPTADKDMAIAERIDHWRELYEMIKKNTSNKSLSQSPAPTVLGNTNKLGSTTILEPCAINTSGTFNTLFGKADNKPVDRTSIYADPSAYVDSDRSKTKIVPSSCARSLEDEEANTSLKLDTVLYTAPSATVTTQYLQKFFGQVTAAEKQSLTTDADETIKSISLRGDIKPSYYARVGAYILYIDPYGTSGSSADDTTNISDEAMIAVINSMVKTLKSQAAAAK